MSLSSLRRDWSANPIREMLAGAVATFALIPEVIAFSFVAGVDPEVGLFASFVIGIVIAFTGGRPAMISAAAGSVALVAAPLVHSHGLSYLLAAGLLAGIIQIAFGLLRLGVLMRFVSKSVRTGFVNALAILQDGRLGPSGKPWLVEVYEREVIGGFAAFVIPAQTRADFARALRQKLIQEIASR